MSLGWENLRLLEDVVSEKIRGTVKEQLHYWSTDHELRGAYVITLLEEKNLEVEIRKTGRVDEFSPEEFRSAVLAAAEHAEAGWDCKPAGIGYPIRFEGSLLGLCILFPSGDIHPLSRWKKEVDQFVSVLGPLKALAEEQPPSLKSLAEVIPERTDVGGESAASKLHWEQSQTRVDVPVQEELARHLLLDLRPLF